MSQAPHPQVLNYADYRKYLRDWFKWKKRSNPNYSNRVLARHLGTTNPSVLSNIIQGNRKLGGERMERLLPLLELSPEQERYFRLLVDFQQAADRPARQSTWLEIGALLSSLETPEIDLSRFHYMSSWIYPAVHELTRCQGFRPDPEWIATHLRPALTTTQAADALELLERLGFLEWRQGALVPVNPIVRTSATVTHLGTRGFLSDSHTLGAEALERLWDGDRAHGQQTGFMGTSFAVPQERIPELRKLLWETQLKVLEFSEQHIQEADRVMHLAVYLYPVSEQTQPSSSVIVTEE